MQIKSEKNFTKSEIPDWFKNKYHDYHIGKYVTEHTNGFGIHGDNPKEKFNQTTVPGKLFSDSYDISLGTTKSSNYIPGYQGHIPFNKHSPNGTLLNDPYFRVGKTNHVLNYKIRLPNYSGHIPSTSINIKGNIRPYCLSTKDEKFC